MFREFQPRSLEENGYREKVRGGEGEKGREGNYAVPRQPIFCFTTPASDLISR
jgi:hypothetical protein